MKRIAFLLFIALSTTTYAQSLMVVEQIRWLKLIRRL